MMIVILSKNNLDLIEKLAYTFIVGLDPDAQRMKKKDYYNFILKWHEFRDTDLWINSGKKWLGIQNFIVKRCGLAVEEANESDKFIIGIYHHKYDDKPQLSTYLTTVSRLLTTILSRNIDQGLKPIFWDNKELPQLIWNSLAQIKPNSQKMSLQILSECDASWSKWEELANSHTLLGAALQQSLDNEQDINVNIEGWKSFIGRRNILLGEPAHNSAANLVTNIDIIMNNLHNGSYDGFTDFQKQEICKRINSLSNEFSQRFDNTDNE